MKLSLIFFKKINNYINTKPKTKKVIGIILILIGFISLITPLTPGSWLMIIGIELLGFEILFLDKIKTWWKSRK